MAAKKKAKKKTAKKKVQVAMLTPEEMVKGVRANKGRMPKQGVKAVFKRKPRKKKNG